MVRMHLHRGKSFTKQWRTFCFENNLFTDYEPRNHPSSFLWLFLEEVDFEQWLSERTSNQPLREAADAVTREADEGTAASGVPADVT